MLHREDVQVGIGECRVILITFMSKHIQVQLSFKNVF